MAQNTVASRDLWATAPEEEQGSAFWREIRQNGGPRCPYCGTSAECVSSTKIFGADVDRGAMWVCFKCSAWTLCRRGTNIPLGILANARLRRQKALLLEAINSLSIPRNPKRDNKRGNNKHRMRRKTMERLANHLGLKQEDCHVGHFDLETTEKALALCQQLAKR